MIYDTDARRFASIMASLAVALKGTEVTKTLLRVYFAALADLDIDEIEAAATRCIQQDTFFPTVARLRELVAAPLGVPEARAARVFDRLLSGAPKYDPNLGAYWTSADVEAKYGPVARECFDAAGGMQAFRTAKERDLPFLRRDFLAAWRPAEAAERAGELPYKHGPQLPAGDPRLTDIQRRLAAHTTPPSGRERALPIGDAA